MKSILLLIVFLLAGCAEPAALYKPVEVSVPVSAPCPAQPVEEPRWPVASLPNSAPDSAFLRALMVENELRKAYEIRLSAALRACLK